jgi:hypothetical protein
MLTPLSGGCLRAVANMPEGMPRACLRIPMGVNRTDKEFGNKRFPEG